MSPSRAACRMRGPLPLLLAAAVLLASLVIAPLTAPPVWGAPAAWAPSTGSAQPGSGVATAPTDEEALLTLSLDSVQPSVAGPGTDVRVSGTLTNLGSTMTPVHSVRVSSAYRGLDTRGAVRAWSSVGELETPVLLGEDHIGVGVAPGTTVRWFIDVPSGTFDPGFEFATLPLRVEVLEPGEEGLEGQDGTELDPLADDAVGAVMEGIQLRSYLPWVSVQEETFNPVDLAWLAPLTLPGDADLVSPEEEVRTQAWSAAIGPESRVQVLLDGLAGTRATYLIDPSLLEPLAPVASLTEVATPPEDQEDPTEAPPEATSEQAPPVPTDENSPSGPAGPQDPDDTGATPARPTPIEPSPGAAPQHAGNTTATGTGPAGSADETSQTSGPNDSESTVSPGTDPEDPTQTPPDETPAPPEEPPTPPTTEGAVAALAEQLRQLPEGQVGWLPVGDTDTAALLELGTGVGTIASLVGKAPARDLVRPGRTDIAWPQTPSPSDGLIESLREVWTSAGEATGLAGADNGRLAGVVVPVHALDEALLTGSAVRPHPAGPHLIGYDESLSGLAATTGTDGQDGRAVQRFLAETLAVYQEGPASDRSLVVAIPRHAEVDATRLQALAGVTQEAPWLAETTVSDLLAAAATEQGASPAALTGESTIAEPEAGPVTEVGELGGFTLAGQSPLTSERLSRIALARTRVQGVTEIVPGTGQVHRTWERVLDRQFSTAWRDDPQDWGRPVETAQDLATEILAGLSINPTTINLYADEGLMQITVTNDLPVPIDGLQMQVEPGNGRLRILGQPEPITIGPESRATVQFRARAVAAGQVPLHTSLSTPNGTQVGNSEETVVRVQPTGVWIYWLLGGVAGVILVLGLVRALRPPGGRQKSADLEQQ